ncbi:MAG TPA: LysE family translocator [Candidatus Kapabacteria bacterium]|nr:LysE family translocator [Candidatus Kapabacteria bacterium]
MLDPARFLVFLSAALFLAIVPGPSIMYVLARTLAGGKREGVLSVAGTLCGGMVHVIAGALGVSLILAKSAIAFAIVKYIGAAYLCFLGIRMLRDARRNDDLPAATPFPSRNPMIQGWLTEALNPKTALFFLSFIPQFVARESGHVFLQFLTLGTISVALNTSADFAVAMLAAPLGERIRSSVRFRRRQRAFTGAFMIGLGIYLGASESP